MADSSGSTITRTFAPPPAVVFDAWLTPASFAAWFGGNAVHVPVDSVTMDVRPGGTWTATMVLGTDLPEIHWHGEYLEIERPGRLVLTLADRPGDERETVTVTFTEVAGGTEMVFHQGGGNLDAAEYARVTEGWQTFFDALQSLTTP
jgi:uncharacterized protein YndB with AHSA1/START domain